MMTISKDKGHRSFDRSRDSIVGEIDRLDAFSEGVGMLLKAMVDDFGVPASDTAPATGATVSKSKAIAAASDVSQMRAYLEIAAARFGYPLASTVVCIKPSSRYAFTV